MNEYESQLIDLYHEAEAIGLPAQAVRLKIVGVLEDISHPAGKDNARLAIPEIRDDLDALMGRGNDDAETISGEFSVLDDHQLDKVSA